MTYQSDQSTYIEEEMRAEQWSGENEDLTNIDMPEITPTLPYIPGKEGVYEAMASMCVTEKESSDVAEIRGAQIVRKNLESLLFDGKDYQDEFEALYAISESVRRIMDMIKNPIQNV